MNKVLNVIVRAYAAVCEVLKREPAASAAVVNAAVVIAAYFGLHVTGNQLIYVVGIVAAFVGAYVRGRVTPVAEPTEAGKE